MSSSSLPDNLQTSDKTDERLEHLMTNKCRLLIKIDSCRPVFQSMVLAIDKMNGTLILDELFPKPDITITPELLLYCEFHENGATTSFTSQTITTTRTGGLPALLIKYPDIIEHDQRRNNFRLQLEKNQTVSAKLTSDNHISLFGTVKDISNHGLRINIQGNQTDEIKSGDILSNCQIKLDDFNQLECQLTVRSKRYFNRPYRHTQIGTEITNIQLTHRDLLTHYVTKQQRQQCRLRSDALSNNRL